MAAPSTADTFSSPLLKRSDFWRQWRERVVAVQPQQGGAVLHWHTGSHSGSGRPAGYAPMFSRWPATTQPSTTSIRTGVGWPSFHTHSFRYSTVTALMGPYKPPSRPSDSGGEPARADLSGAVPTVTCPALSVLATSSMTMTCAVETQ